MAREKLIDVKNLKTYFYTEEGVSKAVDGVDFEIYPGETLALVGESGCGKTVTSLSIMRLISEPPGKIVEGEIYYKGQNLLNLRPEEMRFLMGNEISMIFQDPMASLNPVFTIGDQISESIILHKNVGKKEAMEQSVDMLRKVGIPIPEQRVNEYPHQLSGGMRQRVMIAMALSCNPGFLIADEPTTALDVTIQSQILDLIKDLKDKFDMSILIVTHNLGVVAEVSDRVAVMYAGKIMEYTDVKTLFGNPQHPYTWSLMNSIPWLNQEVERLITIPGTVPSSFEFPKGCKYNTRCPLADKQCLEQEPGIKEIKEGHKVRCWHIDKLEELKDQARVTEVQ